jgi:hypothetical protein
MTTHAASALTGENERTAGPTEGSPSYSGVQVLLHILEWLQLTYTHVYHQACKILF